MTGLVFNIYNNAMNVNRELEKRPVLPSGWRWAKLGEVCDFIRGVTFDKAQMRTIPSDGFTPVLRAGNINSVLNTGDDLIWVPEALIANEQFLRTGDVAICLSSGSASVVGKTAYCTQDIKSSVGAFCGILRARGALDNRYLSFWLRSQDYRAWRDLQARGANIQNLRFSEISKIHIPIPPFSEQKRIAAILNEQIEAVEKARTAAGAQLEAAKALQFSYIQEALLRGPKISIRLNECLVEITKGIGNNWRNFPVLGATRGGLASAKEPPGKHPERYKYVGQGTIFYNPMRILLGSIAHVDLNDNEGITSPDYVVFKTKSGILHHRWFYHWLRSRPGDTLIRSLARGAVRERMLFKRLSTGQVEIPSWDAQCVAVEKTLAVAPLIKGIEAQLHEINSLPAALLRRAFNGEL